MNQSEVEVTCPYCGESITIFADGSAGSRQHTVSDCDVCCRPIELEIRVDDEGEVSVSARRDSEGHF